MRFGHWSQRFAANLRARRSLNDHTRIKCAHPKRMAAPSSHVAEGFAIRPVVVAAHLTGERFVREVPEHVSTTGRSGVRWNDLTLRGTRRPHTMLLFAKKDRVVSRDPHKVKHDAHHRARLVVDHAIEKSSRAVEPE